MTTIAGQVDDAAAQLREAMVGIAGALDYVASRYESTDDQVAQCFAQDPITALGLPEGFDPGPPRIGPAVPLQGSGTGGQP
jgi:hypothetical protein